MEKWRGRVAVVTGASSGLGADFVKQLAYSGVVVVGLARRKERVEELCKTVGNKGKIHPVKCNVSDEKEVEEAFQWIDKNLGGISILINNAGIGRSVNFQGKGDTKGWREILDTNVYGMSLCIRHGLQNMLKHKIDDGHIININSACGHTLVNSQFLEMTMYYCSKHAVSVLTDGLRKELVALKSKIRATSLSPGLVKTEIFEASGNAEAAQFDIYKVFPYLQPEHITQGLFYIISAPPIVNITELTIFPTGQPV